MRLLKLTILFVVLLGTLFVAACGPTQSSSEEKERQTQQESFENLQQSQPAQPMHYSPSREALNKWGETWDDPHKPSFVYLFDSVGHEIAYFVIEGLPVSYCASLTQPEKMNFDYDYGAWSTTAPALDGVYYSSANCQQLFGFDYKTGAYIEFTGGGSFNYLLYDAPLPDPELQKEFPQYGPTGVDENGDLFVAKNQK